MSTAAGIQDHPFRKLGVIPANPVSYARMLTFRLTGAVPAHPLAADWLSGVPAWCLGGNDKYGTCGPTSVANYLVLLYKYVAGEDISVSDDAVFALYRASGNPGFDPATDADDNGVDMTVMCAALMQVGLDITHADGTVENVKPVCYGKVPQAVDDIRATTSVFGGAILAAVLDVVQQAQTDTGLWDYVADSDVWGGHAFMCGAYTSSSGAGTADLTDITWAEPVGATDTFVAEQVQEAYAVVFPLLYNHPAFQQGVDQAALSADFQELTGQPLPAPAPAPPPPAPEPPVANSADQVLWQHVQHWAVAEHHKGDSYRAAVAVRRWAGALGLYGG